MAGLRIVSGDLGGRRLKVPRGRAIRPTGERVRKAIFSVLWSISRGAVEGGKILDLFAGTGAMGLEALSRGYESCLFVESDRQVARVLQSNLGALGVEDRVELLRCDYSVALTILQERKSSFDLLFIDPPYRMLQGVSAVIEASMDSVMRPGALVVLEGPVGSGWVGGTGSLSVWRYGYRCASGGVASGSGLMGIGPSYEYSSPEGRV